MLDGKQLGHYQIIKKIGAGGMGKIYLAKDIELERLAALKILPADFSNSGLYTPRSMKKTKPLPSWRRHRKNANPILRCSKLTRASTLCATTRAFRSY